MRKRRYQVFVSSTYVDLKEARNIVTRALLELDCIPIGMELFPASDLSQWEYIRNVINESDYYVLILAGRYGSVNKETGIGYTEMEYRYASEVANKPVISFLHDRPESLPAEHSERSRASQRQLEKFRAHVKTKLCKGWSSAEQLATRVATSMPKLIETNPAPGWVRLNPDEDAAALLDSLSGNRELGEFYLESASKLSGMPYREGIVAEVNYRETDDENLFLVRDKVSFRSRSAGDNHLTDLTWEAAAHEFNEVQELRFEVRPAPPNDGPAVELLHKSFSPDETDRGFKVRAEIPEDYRGDGLYVVLEALYKIEKRRINTWGTGQGKGLTLTLTFPVEWDVRFDHFVLEPSQKDETRMSGYFNFRYDYWLSSGMGIVWQLFEK